MAMTVAIDLAKTVFELAAADETWRIVERRRLSRRQLEQYFANRSVGRVVMEACGTAHYWGRWFARRDIRVVLLPPITFAPMCGGTRPTVPMPQRCLKPHVHRTSSP